MPGAKEVTDRPAVLLASPMSAALVRTLAMRYDVLGPMQGPFADAAAAMDAASRSRVRAIVSLGTEGIGAPVFASLPAVGIVVCLGSGYDGIDLAAAEERGVAVAHSRDANAASVADVAIALTIECLRDIPRLRRLLHAGQWNGLRGDRPQGRPGLAGRRMGIYGLGAIGHRIALRAHACEMLVGYHGRRRQADVAYPYFESVHELAHWADVLVLSARADGSNRRIVDGKVLRALGAEGYLVNVARGSLVDEPALIEALQSGQIAGAGLDVFANEPDVPASLRELPNVALTPHIGGVTTESRSAMEAAVLANLEAHFAGLPLPFPVRTR